MPKQFNLMDIPISKLNTAGKHMYYSNYIHRLVDKNFNIINLYEGYITKLSLVEYIKTKQFTFTNRDELKTWINICYRNWKLGLKKRLEIADDFILIRNIVKETLLEIETQGAENWNDTIKFIETVDVDEINDMLYKDEEYKTNVEYDNEEDEIFTTEEPTEKREYKKSLETITKSVVKHSKKAEVLNTKRIKKETKTEEKLEEELRKMQIKLDKLRDKNKQKEEKEEAKLKKLENKIICDCKGYYELSHKTHHFATKKHIDWENSQKVII
jgi:hypothetical protein